ncbi:MAG: hypothetical protein NXY57DRAFT_967313 [Lentinula lateritia]|nr:MAG: hypothetical protein NXY57DRAFT_967313 [Lentinula lateritia]
MASTSSETRSSASTTLLPTSLLEAQVLLEGIQLKSTLPLFFESPVFQCLQAGDYSPPLLDSQNSPDYAGSNIFPVFSYPRALVLFCFPSETLRPLSVASGLDLFCSAQMAVRTLQVLTDDPPSTESPEVYNIFEEAAPFLIYIHDFWIGRANCPLFAEQVLLLAESLSLGLPGVHKFEQFPAIPIPFCLRFQEGSAMMCMVPSKDLDLFASLRGQGVLPGVPKAVSPPKVSNVIPLPSATKAPAGPPRALRRNQEVESLKADASSFFSSPRSTHSKDSDNELLGGILSLDTAPRASSVRMGSKPKASVKVVEESKVSDPTPSAAVYKRSWQIVATDEDSTSTEVESEDEDEDEDTVPPPKCLKMTSSISATLPRRSVKRLSVPKWVTKAAVRSAPMRSPDSTFQPVLLADAQGRLRLPEQSTGAFIPFPKFAHARDLMQVNQVIRNACVSVLARGDLEANSAPLPGYKWQACSSRSLKCLGSLDVELAMDALNALHTASTSSTHNLANSLCQAADLNDQLKQIGSLFDTTRELFLRSILDLQNAGEDPVVVLEALKAAEPNRQAINLNKWTIMATLFRWPSPFNLSGLDFDNRTPGEWIELLRSIHSGESTAYIDKDGHLVESSPPPDSAAKAFEGLNKVEKGSVNEGTSSQVGGSIPMELDLPTIKSLAEPTLSPGKGVEKAQTLES